MVLRRHNGDVAHGETHTYYSMRLIVWCAAVAFAISGLMSAGIAWVISEHFDQIRYEQDVRSCQRQMQTRRHINAILERTTRQERLPIIDCSDPHSVEPS